MKRILILISVSLLAINTFANIKLPAIFSDGMVLQQKSAVALWGWAAPGEKISISNSWNGKAITVTADVNGNWKTSLQTPKGGGPYTITFTGTNRVELKDVLIGEVWLCSGQSNMVFSLKGSHQAKEEIAKADYPTIRYFSVERQYGLQDFNDCPGSVWKKTSPATAGSFSAVAYYFAQKIQAELNVPVGIVYSAWGGTPAEAWTPSDVMKRDTVLSKYFDRWKKIQDNVGKDSTEYHQALTKWEKDTIGKKPAEPQTLYYYKRPWREPSVLFNGMIGPVVPFTIKGFLWYQGESNVAYADEYYQLFSSMIQSWREQWKKKDLPFYFVQLAAYGYDQLEGAARLREAQQKVSDKIPHTGMAVTLDVGNMKDIHYTHKKEVGDRLALIALANDYGQKKLQYTGPVYKKMDIKGDSVVVEYKNAIAIDASKGNDAKGFELGYKVTGTDSIAWVPANSKKVNNKIIVWSERKGKPAGLRYGWLLPGEANVMNDEKLPAAPFRVSLSE